MIIQTVHINRKQVPQIIKFIKIMSFCKPNSMIQAENMVNL